MIGVGLLCEIDLPTIWQIPPSKVFTVVVPNLWVQARPSAICVMSPIMTPVHTNNNKQNKLIIIEIAIEAIEAEL